MLAPAACALSVAMPLIDVVREVLPFSWAYPACEAAMRLHMKWMHSNPPIGKPCYEAEDRSLDSCMASLVVSQTCL